MADNIAVNNDDSTLIGTLAADDISSVLYPRTKLVLGADGVNDGDVSSANPLPINDASGSLTVDAPVGTPVFVRLSDGSSAIATLPVSVASVPSHDVTNAGTFAVQVNGDALTALQLIEDAIYTDATGTPSKGVAVMGTDGTNPQLISVDSSGNVQVDLVTANVTNAGTFVVQVDGTALTRLTDIETNTDFGAVTGGGTETGALRVTIANNSTGVVSVDDNGSSLTVDGTVTANAGTNLNTSALALESGGNLAAAVTALQIIDNPVMATVGGVGVMVAGGRRDDVFGGVADGDYGYLRMNASGYVLIAEQGDALTSLQVIDDWDESDRAKVNIIAGQAGVTAGAGSVAANTPRVTLASDDPGVALLGTIDADTGNIATSVGVMDDWDNAASDGASVSGDVAHDTADAGEPVKLGAKASTSLAGLTLVADADRTNLFAGIDGSLYVRNYCLEDVVQERTTNTDGASTAFASGLAAPGANVRLWIKSVDIANSSASFCTVDLRDGAAGSVLWTLPVPAEGGVCKVFDPPLKLTANTALAFDASAATSTLSISANGFKSKV